MIAGERRACGKSSWFVWANSGYAPAGEVLIKVSNATKHGEHTGNAADIPAPYILIEDKGASKHVAHILNAADIPVAYILIEDIGAPTFHIFLAALKQLGN